MKTYHVNRRPFRACGQSCADGFKADRSEGLCYGPNAILEDDGSVVMMDREPWSVAADCCAYCGADS